MPCLPVLLLGLLLGWLTACATVGVPSEAQVAFDHGLRLFQRGQYAEAIPLLQEATTRDPQCGQAYLYLGRSYLNLGQWGNAIPVLRTAFRLAPKRANKKSPSSCSMPCWEAPPPPSRLGASARQWASCTRRWGSHPTLSTSCRPWWRP